MTQRYIHTDSTPGGDGTTSATTGANRAYASRSEWEAAEQATLTENHIATCLGTGADTTTFIIDGWTPGTYTITLQVDSSSRHPGYYSTSHNRCTYTSNGFDQAFIKVYENNVKIIGHQFGMSSSSGASDSGCIKNGDGASVYPADCYFEKNLFEFISGTAGPCQAFRAATTAWSHYFSRNIINGFRNGTTNWWSGFSEVQGARYYAYRNTINNCYYGWYAGDQMLAKQNIVQSCTDGWAGGPQHTISDRNLSDLASDVPGTNPRNSTTVTFVSSTNFHLASSDTGAIGYGADLSGDSSYPISDDIDSVTISGTPDIGADEYVASGPTYTQSASGGLTFAGANIKNSLKTQAGTLAFTGATVKNPAKVLASALSFIGATIKSTAKQLSGSLTFVGALSSLKAFVQAVGGTLSFASGSVSKATGKLVAGTLTFSGVTVKSTNKVLAGVISFAGGAVKIVSKVLAGTLTFAGTLGAVLQSAFTYAQSVGGSLSFSSGIVSKQTAKLLSGALTFTGTTTKAARKLLIGILTLSGAALKSTAKNITGALSFVGAAIAQLVTGATLGALTALLKVAPALGARIKLKPSITGRISRK